MHVMKIIWLLLAACPWMSPGWTDARRRRNIPEEIRTENIQNDMLKEMLRIERNHELSLSRPMPPKEKAIMRSFLEREFEDDDLPDSSPSTSRKHEISLSRPFPRKTMAIIQALLAGMPKDDDFHKDDDLSKDDDFHKGDELSEDDDLSDSSRFIPRNPEMYLSRPMPSKRMPPKRMAIIRSLLQLEAEDDDLSDRSRFIPRYAPYMSTRKQKKPMCCPLVREKIAPLKGVSFRGRRLSLYRDEAVVQTFYQTRCLPNIANKTCRFIDKEYKSKCVQLYTFMYAIGTAYDFPEGNAPYMSTKTEKTRMCCPLVREKITPSGGVSRRGRLLSLYRDATLVQSFYQTRCLPNIANQPCRYIDKEYKSKCVQLYTFVYAVGKSSNVSKGHMLDYIKVKSGCSCKIQP